MLMPTDGTSICAATTLSGSGVGDGVAVGGEVLGTELDGSDALGEAAATGVAVRIGARVGDGWAVGSNVPMIMRATPATPRMIGSAHEERRLTCRSLANQPMRRGREPWPSPVRPSRPSPPGC